MAKDPTTTETSAESPAAPLKVPADVRAALGGMPINPPPLGRKARKAKIQAAAVNPRRDGSGLLAEVSQPQQAARKALVQLKQVFAQLLHVDRSLATAPEMIAAVKAAPEEAQKQGVDIAAVEATVADFTALLDRHFPRG